MSIEKYDYEIVNGRKIRVRPRETVSEIDVNGYFRRQPNHLDGVNTFYAAMARLEKRLETRRFLFGDYVTDSDIRLYVTLARLDIRYTFQLGETKHPLYTYKNLWGYARELWEIPAFKNNTFFADFAVPPVNVEGSAQRSFNYRFLKQIDFAKYWGESVDRSSLSKDPANKLKAETDAGTARSDTDVINNQEDAIIYEKIHAIPSTEISKYTEEELPTRKDPSKLPTLADTREEDYQAIIEEIGNLPDGPDLSPVANKKQAAEVSDFVKANITDAVSEMLNAVDLEKYIESAHRFYGTLEQLEADLSESRFLAGDFVTQADVALYVSLVRFDILYSRYFGPVKYRIQDLKNVSEYLKDLYQIPAFAHNTDFNAIIKQGQADLEQKLFRPSTHYDRVIPGIDLDAQWKVPTERAYLSEDPTHPIYLSNNRRFDLDPTWYELGAESLTKVEEAPQCGCACSLGSK